MTWRPIERAARGLGRPLARLSAAAAAVGAVAFLAGLGSGRAGAALAALQGGWLFFAGLAAGSVAFAAAVRVAHGEWAEALLPVACAGAGFFAPAFALLAVLAGAAGDATFAVRQLLAGLLVFGPGARFAAMARSGAAEPARVRSAGWAYLLSYAVGLSLWAFGFVMEPAGQTTLAVVPAYYFLGAFLSGLAGVAVVAALRDLSGPEVRHDLGKLLFGFAGLWSYLLWSLFLPTWYGNLPGESAFVLARWTGAYRPAAVAVLAAVSAAPLGLLLPERWKRRRGTLAVGATSVLLGLWAERYLLVLPSLRILPDRWNLLVGTAVAAGVAGLFLLSVGAEPGPARRSPDSPDV
jgi:hypothetical protein